MAKLDATIKKLLNDFSKTQIALNEPGKPALVSGVKLGDLIEESLSSLSVVKDAVYDFDTHGGAIGSVSLGLVVPAGAIITKLYTNVDPVLASAGLATVEIKANGSSLKAATAFDDASYIGAQEHALAAPVLVSADSELNIDIAVADLTAGKMRIMVEFITKE
jgi:hypothetical protein